MLQIEQLTAQLVAEGLQQVKQLSGELSGAGAPDPLVQLKEQELQLKAQSDQADNQIDQAKVQLDQQSMQMRSNQFQRRLASQEKQTQARIQSAMERELLKQRNNGGTPR
jgi:L-lysine 2,3-aminomutase